jgi:TRAP-type C4-dicarboxylate transport system permease small subunit
MDGNPLPRGDGWVGRLHSALQAVSVALLACYFVLVIVQVFFRYVLNDSVFWAEEVVRYELIWSVMLGSALVAYRRGHIRIEIAELMLPPAGRRVVYAVADALTLAFCAILLWTGIQLIERTMLQRSASLDAPMWVIYSAIPVGAALQIVFTVAAWRRRATTTEPGGI